MEYGTKNLFRLSTKMALLVAAILFILGRMGIVKIQWPWDSVLGKHREGWIFGDTSAVTDFLLSGRSLIVIALVAMCYLTYRAVKVGKRHFPLYMITFWGLSLGLLLGGGSSGLLDHWKKQNEETKKASEIQEKISTAVKTCESFSTEKICAATTDKDRDEKWAEKVSQCFTSANVRYIFDLPDECTALPDISKDLTPVVPPAILQEQVREGEKIAKLLSPQIILTAGEFWGADHYSRFAGIADIGDCLFADPNNPSTPAKCREDKVTQERRFKAEFQAMLRGVQKTELKAEIEKKLGATVGLSLSPETLTEDQRRGIGIVIGLYNHLLHTYNERAREEKVRLTQECKKYPENSLRPARCVPEKKEVIQ